MPAASNVRTPQGWPVVWFFVLAFAFTWSLQLPGVLAQRGLLPGATEAYMPFALLGIFGPLAAATLITAREGGRPAVRELFAGLRKWRAPLACYVVGLLLPPLALSLVLWFLRLAGREGPLAYLPDGGRLVAAFVISFAEEVGWRGFALPRLQARMSPLGASGVIGVLWTLWHIPMFLAANVPLSLLLLMVLFFSGGSLLLTWIYNRSGGSVLLAVMAHLAAQLNNSHLPLPADVVPLVVSSIIYGVLGLAVIRPPLARW